MPQARKSAPRASSRSASAPAIDIIIASPLWNNERGVGALLRRSIAAAARTVPTLPGEVAIVLTGDSEIRALNRRWRGKDEPTNVLSFPAPKAPSPGGSTRKRTNDVAAVPRLIGDIVLAYETTAAEARAQRKSFADHLAHLAVHGYFHLIGYDHEARPEAETMERLEIETLARLNVPNPYVARGAGG